MSGYVYEAYGVHAVDPYGQAYAVPAYPTGAGEESRTIFITGFPLDVKERELNNLLRFLPGYEVRCTATLPRAQPGHPSQAGATSRGQPRARD
jgi:hypothetical protein